MTDKVELGIANTPPTINTAVTHPSIIDKITTMTTSEIAWTGFALFVIGFVLVKLYSWFTTNNGNYSLNNKR